MLVLTRKYQEKIQIGENITITVLRMKGKAVRLGIEAPDHVPVLRGELSFTIDSDADRIESHSGADEAEAVSSGASTAGRGLAKTARMPKEWEAKSRPDGALLKSHEPASTIAFGRVSRDRVSGLVPKLVAGSAPLRAIMEQRTTT